MRGGRGPWRGRGARARVAGAALHARGRARGWRGLRCMRGGRGQWRGRGARMHARKEHTHLQTQHRAHHLLLLPLRHRFDEGSDGDASALDRRCDSLLVCVMCRAHNESRAPPTSCTREGEHEGTRAARRALQARCERAGCLGNSSLRCEFWRQVFCVLFVPGVSRIFHARTFRQRKHRLLANMKRLYQRSF